jgi:hypothetical protein
MRCCLVWSRRLAVFFDNQGGLETLKEATVGDPACAGAWIPDPALEYVPRVVDAALAGNRPMWAGSPGRRTMKKLAQIFRGGLCVFFRVQRNARSGRALRDFVFCYDKQYAYFSSKDGPRGSYSRLLEVMAVHDLCTVRSANTTLVSYLMQPEELATLLTLDGPRPSRVVKVNGVRYTVDRAGAVRMASPGYGQDDIQPQL